MSKNLFPSLIVLVVILVGGLGIFLIMNQSSSDTNQLNVNQQENPSSVVTPTTVPQTVSPTPVPTIVNSQTLPSGLKIDDEKIGTGAEVKSGDTVVIHYTGSFTNGQKFDSSVDRNQPFETKIGVGQVIQGWDEGVVGMKVGGKRWLTIPPDLAYGKDGIEGAIPPNSTLVFQVELLGIK